MKRQTSNLFRYFNPFNSNNTWILETPRFEQGRRYERHAHIDRCCIPYEFSEAFEVGVGGNWLDHRFADYAESATIPGYIVWNAMASYRLNRSLFLQLNVLKLTNKLHYDGSYYTSASENHVIPGAGRSARLSIGVNF